MHHQPLLQDGVAYFDDHDAPMVILRGAVKPVTLLAFVAEWAGVRSAMLSDFAWADMFFPSPLPFSVGQLYIQLFCLCGAGSRLCSVKLEYL